MTPSVSFQNPKKVKKASDGHKQIHYCQNHWVVSHFTQDEVSVYDSLNPTTISDELKEQLQLLYGKKSAALPVNLVSAGAQEPNLIDCGLHAIANATALAFGEAPGETAMMKEK